MRNNTLFVGGRRLNQAVRRLFWRYCRHGRREEIWREIARIACVRRPLTTEEEARLGALHWTLGSGSVFRYTPQELAELGALADELVAELLRTETAEHDA